MKRYTLQHLDCASCASEIERTLAADQSVRSASVQFATKTLIIDTDDISHVQTVIQKIEPDVVITGQDADPAGDFSVRKEIMQTASALLLYGAGFILPFIFPDAPSYVRIIPFTAAWLAAGWHVMFSAVRNIRHGRIFDENFLMTVSTVGAFAVGADPEAAAVMIFYNVGEFFQALSVAHSRRSIQSLLKIRPDSANLIENGSVRSVAAEDVIPGQMILIKPGERIPLDGIIVDGESSIDTSAMTGESVPRSAVKGDAILSGTVNLHGSLTVQVTKPFSESSVSKILELVENASTHKANAERFITSFARIYTPIVVAVAAVVAIIPPLVLHQPFAGWIYRALILLVISCPCALVVSIPLGYFGGIGGASRRGILVKGAQVFDVLAKIRTVVFDKTGTLTKGVFRVTQIVRENGFTEDEILRFAADAEAHSTHPIARSIVASYGKEIRPDDVTSYVVMPGLGVSAVISGKQILAGSDRMLHEKGIDHRVCCNDGTVVHVVVDGIHAGYIIVSDEVKNDARLTVQSLTDRGIGIVMLTGDTNDAATAIASKLGITDFRAELLPDGKVAELEKIMARNGGTTVFVGDGINDAPVIARADVGTAMGAFGSDAAIETADLVLMTDSPSKLCEAIDRAKKVRRIVNENIVFALGVKLAVAIIGISGEATMWEAVFADIGVTLIAVFNSMRALR